MKLYGLAIAAIPRENDKNIIDVTCTPIAIEDGKREEFKKLKKPAPFEATFDIRHPKELLNCLVKTTNLIGKLVELQEASLTENRIKQYRPVALQIGENSKRRIEDKRALYVRLFGDPSFKPRSRMPKKYTEAYAKLSQLLAEDKCTLKWGSYIRRDDHHLYTPSIVDRELKKLKKRWDAGDKTAEDEIIDLSRRVGIILGEHVSGEPEAFGFPSPLGYARKKAMQERLPSYSFFHWNEKIRAAFYDGFRETAKTPFYRHIKLPLDPRNPYFTDTCADLIMDQFEIINKTRKPKNVDDKPLWRKRISDDAERIAHSVDEKESKR